MKKLLLSLFLTLSLPNLVMAEEQYVRLNGILYVIENGVARVSTQLPKLNGDIVIPEKITYDDVEYTVGALENKAFSGTKITSCSLPDNITSIPTECFSGCKSLVSVSLPKNLKTLSDGSFQDCVKLSSVSIPDKVISLGESCFDECNALTSIQIPEAVTSIGAWCFNGCESLTSITIPENITTLATGTFNYCTGLTSITIPDKVTSIDGYCFSQCSKLAEVTLNEGLKSLGSGTFSFCSELQSVTIPESVKTIDFSCFNKCSKLSKVVCKWTSLENIKTDDRAFTDISADATLLVPSGTIEEYKSKSPWKDFSKIEEYGESGINTQSRQGAHFTFNGNNVSLSGLKDGDVVSIYTQDGKLISSKSVSSGSANLCFGAGHNIAILKVGMKTYKMLVK